MPTNTCFWAELVEEGGKQIVKSTHRRLSEPDPLKSEIQLPLDFGAKGVGVDEDRNQCGDRHDDPDHRRENFCPAFHEELSPQLI